MFWSPNLCGIGAIFEMSKEIKILQVGVDERRFWQYTGDQSVESMILDHFIYRCKMWMSSCKFFSCINFLYHSTNKRICSWETQGLLAFGWSMVYFTRRIKLHQVSNFPVYEKHIAKVSFYITRNHVAILFRLKNAISRMLQSFRINRGP